MPTSPLISILGGGQLGRMLALAGYPLGLRFRFLDPSPDAPAGEVGELVVGDYESPAAREALADGATAITYEFENVPVAAARALERHAPVYPPPAALEAAQDRLAEKTLFRDLGIPTPPFAPINSEDELHAALMGEGGRGGLGFPAVLKTRRFGYDGKGQALIREPADLGPAWRVLGSGSVPLILEGFVPFEREVSVLAARSAAGEHAVYPIVQNRHARGILRESVAPAPGPTTPRMQALAEEYAHRLLDALGYVGLLAVEFFEVDGALLANEMAPRVHNSGHWTTEGAETSQFENHLRAILGLPLGSTAPVGASVMLNLIGQTPAPADILAISGAHLHLYGKAPKPGRKLGHITARAPDEPTAAAIAASVRNLIGPD